ncbi:MAG: segregation/condensation protein A [Megasphaera sp.]|nr:segregation/condensation protein A [Megasphaera sp.]MCH4187087.1 segregation/condensation protein A [Megasphaera sp.]MCH4216977.1 segregation/condensation protein A [Megasphaera sp.]
MEEYQYKVSDFKGPLDLLLYLIEKNKVDIYNIPIVEITDQFNEYVNQIDVFDVNYGSKFFVMAATLLQIKSRHLLPKPAKAEAEEEETPEEALIRQLVEYKRMKGVSQVVGSLWEQRSLMLDRQRTPMACETKFTGVIDRQALYEAFQVVYQSLKEQKPAEIRLRHEVYSVDECMQRVTYILRRSQRPTAVLDVFRSCRSKVELVVTFLAVLELLKLGRCHTVSEGEDGNTVALRYMYKGNA